jgi:hypothetical protein
MPPPLPKLQPISTDKASVARMWDYYLDGYHNFAVDREAAERAISFFPGIPLAARANRGFLTRTVRYCLDQGIDQFLDIGSGIPTAGNVHETAQTQNPDARVVYVDIDPVAVTHSRFLLENNPNAGVVQADAAEPEHILAAPVFQQLIDLRRPVGVILAAVLHFIPDDATVMRTVRILRDAMPSGSYLILSHASHNGVPDEVIAPILALYAKSVSTLKYRPMEDVVRYFEGLDVVAPGIVPTPGWRPESEDDVLVDHPERALTLGGVARKPSTP